MSPPVLLGFPKRGACGICFQYALRLLGASSLPPGEVLTPGVSGEGAVQWGQACQGARGSAPWAARSPRACNAFNLEEALLGPRLDYGLGEGGLTNGEWRRVGLS